MWPFRRKATKADLQGWTKVKIEGWTFTIRKLNPIIDFPADRMPQIFAEGNPSRRPVPTRPVPGTEQHAIEDMKLVLHKGVVSPAVSLKDDPSASITADDLLRQGDLGIRLYIEIIAHSLRAFKGLKGLFFWARTRRALYTVLDKSMASVLQPSPLKPGT